jgi:regulatory protein YycI of two-component signal transduction system YycFG
MDWRRAKTLLIVAFLLLDSFLAYQLWTSRGKDLEVIEQALGSSSSFQDILKSKNIVLSVEAPTETPDMYYLNIKYEDFNQKNIASLSNQNIHINGNVLESQFAHPIPQPLNQTKGELAKEFSESIFYADEYAPDAVMTTPSQLTYLQRWSNYPFFGAVMQFSVTNNQITGYRQTHFQVVNKGTGKRVIASLVAVRTLIESDLIKNGEKITAIELGYYGHTYDAEIQVVAPVWRIVHGSGQVHYVNGITGVIEKIPSMPKKE